MRVTEQRSPVRIHSQHFIDRLLEPLAKAQGPAAVGRGGGGFNRLLRDECALHMTVALCAVPPNPAHQSLLARKQNLLRRTKSCSSVFNRRLRFHPDPSSGKTCIALALWHCAASINLAIL